MLLVFVAFIAFANYLFTKFGSLTGVNEWIAQVTDGRSKELNLQFILGYAISPLMWLIGIAPQDMIHAGSLLGQKIIMTEFIGYVDLANLKSCRSFCSDKVGHYVYLLPLWIRKLCFDRYPNRRNRWFNSQK